MKRLLMIVDPQIDFISGSLPVPHAAEAMDKLAAFIQEENGNYLFKIITTDWHPTNHCSFKENGGEWPVHCQQNKEGAEIYPALMNALHQTSGAVEIVRKGTNINCEEYSVFQNPKAAARIKEIIEENNIQQIDICGIAGDICVLDTLKDGINIYGKSMFHVLEEYCPSLDGGVALNQFIQKTLQS